jgi:hypothetical protein
MPKIILHLLSLLLCAGAVAVLLTVRLGAQVTPSSSAPATEPISTQFNVAVYLARVCNLSAEQRRHLGLPAIEDTAQASFASFDLKGNSQITVTCPQGVSSAKILPSSSGVVSSFSGNRVTFTVVRPGQLTLEVNGDWVSSLHLFVNPPDTNIPGPHDPNVIYFGPGVHVVESVKVTSGQTVYLAPGAVVYGTATQAKPISAIFSLQGSNITLRGRGIIDGSLCPRGTRSIVYLSGTNVTVEDVVLRDSCGFTFPIRRAQQVTISNVKVFGWRGNSDGMDICNSRGVNVSNCFLRTFDDLIVLKTDKGQGEESNVTVRHCVLWNEIAHALSLGAELREPLTNISFSDCDIIRDKGREWLLRVYDCDSGAVSNVTFANIRIEEAQRLMSLWIGKQVWSKEAERGHINDVVFQNISSVLPEVSYPFADLVGYDAGHAVIGVNFQHVVVGGKLLSAGNVQQNAFVHGVVITP